MAGSKGAKGRIKQGGNPSGRIRAGGDPASIMSQPPAWSFLACDSDSSVRWAFCKERLTHVFWDVILPYLRNLETMTYGDIFVSAKKQNHSNQVEKLNKCARERMEELNIEEEALRSLRLGGSLRIYGYLVGSVFNIVWYDDDHGDNDTCVCRCYKKYT